MNANVGIGFKLPAAYEIGILVAFEIAHPDDNVVGVKGRADLGDSRCKVNLAALTVTGTITTATDRRSFTDTSRGEAADYWNGGLLTWTSGLNAGRKMEVKSFVSGGAFTLFLPMPSEVAVGDAYSLRPGCDKKFSTCKARYNNIKNFRGEPNVPGNDQILAYPDGK